MDFGVYVFIHENCFFRLGLGCQLCNFEIHLDEVLLVMEFLRGVVSMGFRPLLGRLRPFIGLLSLAMELLCDAVIL